MDAVCDVRGERGLCAECLRAVGIFAVEAGLVVVGVGRGGGGGDGRASGGVVGDGVGLGGRGGGAAVEIGFL